VIKIILKKYGNNQGSLYVKGHSMTRLCGLRGQTVVYLQRIRHHGARGGWVVTPRPGRLNPE